jgi:hypothetical protein
MYLHVDFGQHMCTLCYVYICGPLLLLCLGSDMHVDNLHLIVLCVCTMICLDFMVFVAQRQRLYSPNLAYLGAEDY